MACSASIARSRARNHTENDVPLQAYVDRTLLLNSVSDQITLTGEQKNVLKDLVQVKVKASPRKLADVPERPCAGTVPGRTAVAMGWECSELLVR
jgi:hypothetical protein